jgi:leucine dehydrogenase
MSVFSNPYFDGHENVIFCHDAETGLRALIAIHNTTRGPALGGCRFYPYASEEEALKDVLRLSRGMTYKSALANLDLGGGKAVIIGDPKVIKTPELLAAFGRRIEQLHGTYITAEDVGTTTEDMGYIHEGTSHVVGLNQKLGGSGDPSVVTSYGVFMGLKACLKFVFGDDDCTGRHVAIQGMGHVGMKLAKHLKDAGARVTIADINRENIDRALSMFKAQVVSPDEIYDVEADVFSPCAMGGIINDLTLQRLKCRIVAGAANNQLAEDSHAEALMKKGITYAPDYVINAGGLINVAHEGPTYNREAVLKHVSKIFDTLIEILEAAKTEDISTRLASDRIAELRIKEMEPLQKLPRSLIS